MMSVGLSFVDFVQNVAGPSPLRADSANVGMMIKMLDGGQR